MIRSTSALFFNLENLAFSLHFATKESDLFFSFIIWQNFVLVDSLNIVLVSS